MIGHESGLCRTEYPGTKGKGKPFPSSVEDGEGADQAV